MLRQRCHRWIGICAVLTLGCQPPERSGPVDAYVFVREPSAESGYRLRRARVEHLDSLRELRGRDFEVRRNSEFNQGLFTIEVERGDPFALEYTVDAEGVVVPGDLHSFYALSMYRNLDRTASLFREHGYTPVRPLDVFYFPKLDNTLLGDSRSSFTDNAAFASEANGFLIVPSFVLADLPMLLNEGILAHEFGHSVIHQQMFGDAREWPQDSEAGGRHFASMHEGVADLVALVATGEPDSFRPTADIDRNLAEPRDYTAEDLVELNTASTDVLEPDPFDPHRHGSLMARAVYEAWPKDGSGAISEADRVRLLEALLATTAALPRDISTFNLAMFPDLLVTHLSDAERATACAVLRQRLAPFESQLTHCGGM